MITCTNALDGRFNSWLDIILSLRRQGVRSAWTMAIVDTCLRMHNQTISDTHYVSGFCSPRAAWPGHCEPSFLLLVEQDALLRARAPLVRQPHTSLHTIR